MMPCEEARPMLSALLDGELDAGHARAVEAHAAGCALCAPALVRMRDLQRALSDADLRFRAPPALRACIDKVVPAPQRQAPSRRSLLLGFALGAAVSAVAATGAVFLVIQADQDQRILGDAVSAHLRSLQAEHLTDVQSSDRHTVKPWFNGRLDVAPPVVDLAAQGFTLIGGRLDYIDGRAVAAIAYRRRAHIINLFVFQPAGAERSAARHAMVQGFNVLRWTEQGLRFLAISDINADELSEFGAKFEAALRAGA